jgi:hypothetical protein
MFSSPAIIRSKVDLPQPEGPTSTTNSPSRMEMSTPWMTAVAPNALRTSRIATEAIHSSQAARAASHIFFFIFSTLCPDALWTIRLDIRSEEIIPLSPSEMQARRKAP